MVYNYDKLYAETPDALGDPSPAFVQFFNQDAGEGLRILDLGCGQGRDALFIARRGHRVVGVDLSANGIRDLVAAAANENLSIEGVVADITRYTPDGIFDIILLDRTLHMLPEAPRRAVLKQLLDHVVTGGWVLIADEAANMEGFAAIFAHHSREWTKDYAKPGYLFVRQE
ncbi:class I SAM-dependent methyltransferase [Phaeobacter porticola]|uniref:Acetyltransferase and methytransferase domain-containing protein n=1 Tax=Phaeobacter porticola TaxID=1844006 RepID=A0A1L3I1K5_9RHOB|nr:class I SAM-dependent methyltransferase [Phaeobacter porticola]APG46000.1 acetyltransferase and methytransferase domain-containing protein [Phaeobacter porticola]